MDDKKDTVVNKPIEPIKAPEPTSENIEIEEEVRRSKKISPNTKIFPGGVTISGPDVSDGRV